MKKIKQIKPFTLKVNVEEIKQEPKIIKVKIITKTI